MVYRVMYNGWVSGGLQTEVSIALNPSHPNAAYIPFLRRMMERALVKTTVLDATWTLYMCANLAVVPKG